MMTIISLLVYSVPMNAIADEHVCIPIEKSRQYQSSTYVDGTYHSNRYHVFYECQVCHASMGDGYISEQETHLWHGYYEDLGHVYRSHKYKIHCSYCSATIEIEISCQYELNGIHSTPY